MDEGQAMIVSAKRKDIDWDELRSVIVQALDPLGFVPIAGFLGSDIANTHPQTYKFTNLRAQFLGGFWVKCAETICGINGLSQEHVIGAMMYILSMWLLERSDLDKSFTMYASILFTADNRKKMQEIVADIRKSLKDEDNYLSNFAVNLELRKWMLKKLESNLPSVAPTLHQKLLKLIKYGIDAQIYSCLSHNTKEIIPLYCDHSCSEKQLPTKTIQILTGHKKEVCCVKFSHNGMYLASGSADCTAIIWEVPAGRGLKTKYILRGHGRDITCVSWSPNDELLLTCALGEHITVWDVRTGLCICMISEEYQVLRSCTLLSSCPIEVVYGMEKVRGGSICLLRNDGQFELVFFPRLEHRLTVEFAVTPNGRKLIYYDSADDEGEFNVRHIIKGTFRSFKTGTRICGISVTEDSETLILNLVNDEIHMLDLKRCFGRPLIYWNFEQITGGNISIPCVGGVDSNFLVSGTRDSKVCIWNRRQARPIAVLSGHTSVVRCVSWNPQRHQMLASASDDNTIRIWGPQSQDVPHLFRHD